MFGDFSSFYRQFKRETIALSTLWCWSAWVLIGNVHDCFSDKSSILKSECYISFAPLQRLFNLLAEWVSINMSVCMCVLHSTFPELFILVATGPERWNVTSFFSCRGRPCPCWISVIELVSYCVWSMVCRPRVRSVHKNLLRIKCCLFNLIRRSVMGI